MSIHQHELRERLPGTAGGLAVARQRGAAYLAALGQRGGLATLARLGREHLAALARLGAAERWRRAHSLPRTITADAGDGTIYAERQIPYWPHQARRRRRKRPEIVRISLEAGELL
ncbi:MAG TPA: hypothetical protein VFS21_09190 [Roseiflexaceae bacterium]|nr:hypothetical protein [Roseiflexaceae bacterium]